MSMLTAIIIASMGLLVLVAIGSMIMMVSRYYIKVPPNMVLVVYGRQYQVPGAEKGTKRGFKLVTGGAALCIPMLEKYEFLPLNAFQIPIQVVNVPSERGVLVTVDCVASMKIDREDSMLDAAVGRFLNRPFKEVEQFAKEVVEGGLRGIVATLNVEELIQKRAAFGDSVQQQVNEDLRTLGVKLDNLLIQNITDEHGYIQALGVAQTAVVKRDAEIAQAEADRDQAIKVAEAQQISDEKASEAKRIGETAKAAADEEISNAERQRDVVAAENQQKIRAEEAKIDVAAKIAAAEKDKELRVAQVAAAEAEVEARIKLQEREKDRRDAELQASVIVEAERNKEATLITADAKAQAAVVEADGQKKATIEKAQGDRQATEEAASADRKKAEEEAEGRKAQAAAQLAEMQAKAEGDTAAAGAEQAELEAKAAGLAAQLNAEAEGLAARLSAEAEGVRKKAEAYAALPKQGVLLEVLNHAPEVINALGEAVKEAGLGTLVPMSEAIGNGLANIDEVKLVQVGSANGQSNGHSNGHSVLSQFMDSGPSSIIGLVEKINALGLGPAVDNLLKQAGIDTGELLESATQISAQPKKAVTPSKKEEPADATA